MIKLFVKRLIKIYFFLQVFLNCNPVNAQSSKLIGIDITSGRVLLDSISINQKLIVNMDTLKYKFDVFNSYSRTFDTRHQYFILESDTAIIVLDTNGTLLKTIQKPGDIEGMTYDPINDKVYCAMWRINTYFFTELNILTSTFRLIRSLASSNLHTASIDYDNKLYYIISDTRGLFKINIATGVKIDSIKYFTVNNCRCNSLDIESGKIATICNVSGKDIMQLYDPTNKSFQNIDTLNKYGVGFFSFESSSLDQNNGNWYINLGKKIGVKNIRSNTKMDTILVPFNRIRSLVLVENLCYRPLFVSSITFQNPKCSGASDGEVSLAVSGGRKEYSYTIDGVNFQSFGSFLNQSAGNYLMRIKDKNGFCEISIPYSLKDPMPIKVLPHVKNNLCFNSLNGSIYLKSVGEYQYSYALNNLNYQSDSVFQNLKDGQYTVYIKNQFNCVHSVPDIVISSPPQIVLDSLYVKDIRCYGEQNGEVKFLISGGVMPYQYSLDSVVFKSTGHFKYLQSGHFKYFIKDNNECGITETFKIKEPTNYVAVADVKNSQCFGYHNGSVKIKIQNGNLKDKYWYRINNSTDSLGVDDSLIGLPSGNYDIKVNNQNNCTEHLKVEITEPLPLEINRSNDTTLCTGQSVKLNLKNNEATYYRISSNNGLLINADSLTLSQAGVYFTEIKNNSNCSSKDTFIIQKIDLNVAHDFLMPSVAFLTDTVYAVNISWPLADYSHWKVNRTNYSQFQKDSFTLGCLFADTGHYQLTLQSRYKACGYHLTKQVSIKSKLDSLFVQSKYGFVSPFIQQFQVYSNPHNGEDFTIKVILRDTSNFSIYKLNSGNGAITGEKHFMNQKTAEFNAFNSIQSEVYYLKLVVGKESRIIKVVAIQ